MKTLVGKVIIGLYLVIACDVSCQDCSGLALTEDFSTFDSSLFTLYHSTEYDSANAYVVLVGTAIDRMGRLYLNLPVFIDTFRVSFDFFMGGGTGADGMIFAFTENRDYWGTHGGDLDFVGSVGYGVALSTWQNEWDPSEECIGLVTNGPRDYLDYWIAPNGALEGDLWRRLTVENNGGHVKVWLDDTLRLDHQIVGYEPFVGYFGFTAATGGATNRHLIDNLSIETECHDPTCATIYTSPQKIDIYVPPQSNTIADRSIVLSSVTSHSPHSLLTWTAFHSSTWLTLDHYAGFTEDIITMSFDIDYLPPGRHVDSVVFTVPEAINSPYTTQVTIHKAGHLELKDDFSSFDEDLYTLIRDATCDTINEYVVLNPWGVDRAGRVYLNQPVLMDGFRVSFDFLLGCCADGAVFAFTKNRDYLGSFGGDLFFSGAKGYGVVLNTYPNHWDPSGECIGLVQNGPEDYLDYWIAPSGALDGGFWRRLTVENDGGRVKVWLDDTLRLDHQILGYEPFVGYFGFTSATAGGASWHLIDNLEILVEEDLRHSVNVDIKPGSCPNPLNAKHQSDRGKAVLPVAVLGTDALDVHDIDPETVTLAGVSPVRWSYEDVSTAVDKSEDSCACSEDGPDGYDDLTLKFYRSEIIAAIGGGFDRLELLSAAMTGGNSESEPPHSGGNRGIPQKDEIVLTLAGELNDGTAFEGYDCITLLTKSEATATAVGSNNVPLALTGNFPNPFNPSTNICFSLPEASQVTLEVFNILGRKVTTLIDRSMDAGHHSVEWNGHNIASGVYFYRLTVGEFIETKKMVLLK
ncbi:MAG: T9SS type A sorting domain-containing protein [Candidatus Zixiibacteriota bacterium]|nr:MAG: T9SS type A sorting domain-containing protein [candidate division Zixibacteria bacterium]